MKMKLKPLQVTSLVCALKYTAYFLRYLMHHFQRFYSLTFLVILILTNSACADQEKLRFEAGTHYQVLTNPAKVIDPNKIEVMEVFWYGCSHCFDFEPLLRKWKAQLPHDVIFSKTPAVWREYMKFHANIYYTAEALKLPQSGHDAIFALLIKNPRLIDPKLFSNIFSNHGIETRKFDQMINSFGIITKVSQAQRRIQKNYKIQGTPEIIINGKYRISSKMAGGQAEMLQVADSLINLERRKRL